MRICIIGGGNIGTLLSAELTLKGHEVRLLSSQKAILKNNIIIEDKDNNTTTPVNINTVTSNKKTALDNAEVVIITYPANIVHSKINNIIKYVDRNAIIGFMPGTGGIEYCCKQLRNNDNIIFGLQRVHAIARLNEDSKIVVCQGRRKQLNAAVIPQSASLIIKDLIESLFNIPCQMYNNYLNITLTPSNPILHTTRLYSLFLNLEENGYERNPFFYKDWDNQSSQILIACDKEVQNICEAINFDLSGVKSLLEHYEVNNAIEMTNKISNLPALQNLTSPMIIKDGRFFLDKENRYFTADFPYGLCIIKGFAEIFQINTPNIDKVLKWYERLTNVEYFIKNKFIGKDLYKTGIPQNYGLLSVDHVINFYTKE